MFDANLDTFNFNRKSSFYSRSLKKLLPRKKELVRQSDDFVHFMLSRFSIFKMLRLIMMTDFSPI